MNRYQCSKCGHSFYSTTVPDRCPSCSVWFSGVRCTSCGYQGSKTEFSGSSCPKCGGYVDTSGSVSGANDFDWEVLEQSAGMEDGKIHWRKPFQLWISLFFAYVLVRLLLFLVAPIEFPLDRISYLLLSLDIPLLFFTLFLVVRIRYLGSKRKPGCFATPLLMALLFFIFYFGISFLVERQYFSLLFMGIYLALFFTMFSTSLLLIKEGSERVIPLAWAVSSFLSLAFAHLPFIDSYHVPDRLIGFGLLRYGVTMIIYILFYYLIEKYLEHFPQNLFELSLIHKKWWALVLITFFMFLTFGWFKIDDGISSAEFSLDSLNKEFVLVEGGLVETFNNQGVDTSSGKRSTGRKLNLRNFFISKYEVTFELWMYATPGFNPPITGKLDSIPALGISWYEAIQFCNRLSKKHGLQQVYQIDSTRQDSLTVNHNFNIKEGFWSVYCNFDANGYRLPTTEEWEFAARGGKLSKNFKYSGSNNISEISIIDTTLNSVFYLWDLIGQHKPNELGIFDMNGNVMEWCWNIEVDSIEISNGDISSGKEFNLTGNRALKGGDNNSRVEILDLSSSIYLNPNTKGLVVSDRRNHFAGDFWVANYATVFFSEKNKIGLRLVRSSK